ncbi:MAG TPA: uroporphyrinogen-III synthase, partial [Gemmatimonadales bacterium]|nr:uroporphyrinogen-III synthase [Gemmatimonadales bacterium]
MSGLRGRAVVITRSRSQAGPLAEALLERGGIPVFFPTIDIRPLDDCSALDRALHGADRYDWIVFTSVNTVNAVWGRLARLGRVELTGSSRIAAVGPATVTALAERGISTTTMPAEFRGSAIAATMGQVAGRRVLLPHAALAREETAASLRAAGAIVDEVVAYQTLPPAPDGASLAALEGEIDAVTFTSPSTVRNFVTLAGPGALA